MTAARVSERSPRIFESRRGIHDFVWLLHSRRAFLNGDASVGHSRPLLRHRTIVNRLGFCELLVAEIVVPSS
jgi:hypothetical protein